MKRIVVTGAGGNMGKALVAGLRATGKYDVVAAAHHPSEERGEILLDLNDRKNCIEVLKGAYAVIHLGGVTRLRIFNFVDDAVPVNIVGTFNLYEAARLCGVKKMIYGSSNHVYGAYRLDENIGDDAPYRPDSLYGLSKCCGEVIGRYYSDCYDICCFNVRIGHSRGIRTSQAPRFHPGTRELKQLLSNEDALQLFMCCIEADESIKYMAFPGTSDNTGNPWDITAAKKYLGYAPKDDGAELICEETENNETEYRGGAFLDMSKARERNPLPGWEEFCAEQ